MPIQVEYKKDGETVGIMVLSEKTFRTGSTGYFGNGQAVIDGVKYQLQSQAVKVKSGNTGKQGK